ncbi:hypothetical protein SAMN04489844_0641 [Nocardioides exalbidus]|uniref:Uncharacterized protein n=1 Tax=Nocardioides exalbidus TaxID=402596 RepID=A0A1H4KNV3_9ACTN|nr:hypothetical protein [Nocardioides exalbidus]SEB59936.1 hypothetical protein SAMN04489844_0641 [Nocardioides exalbidus]
MGASLEELLKGGLTEVPPIADAFTNASTTLSGISTGGMFADGGPFDSNNPKEAMASLMSAMASSTQKSGAVLDDVAQALVTTARDFAKTDDEIRRAFIAAGGTLA